MKAHYPARDITRPLSGIVAEIAESRMSRINGHRREAAGAATLRAH